MVRSVSAGGGPGRAASSARRCAAALPHNRICRDGADVSSGERACPCSSVLRRLVVRSVSAGRGDPGVQPRQQGRCAAALPHNRIHRDGADVSSGERACPCASVLRETGGAQRRRRRGDPGVQRPQQGGALLLCPTTGSTGMVLTCPLASRHAPAPLS